MALSGVQVTCAYGRRDSDVPLLSRPQWSQTMASATTTNSAAPVNDNDRFGILVFAITTTVDIFYAIGPNPNASNSPRMYLGAGKSYDIEVQPGDKLAWILA